MKDFNLNVNVPTISNTEAILENKAMYDENYNSNATEEEVVEPLKIVPIAGFNGDYWISNYGQVFSNKSSEMVELKPYLVGSKNRYKTNYDDRYYSVSLCKDSVKKIYKIHRLVALHFVVNPRMLNCVDHINGNQLDNRASNLRWCTNKENLNNPNSNKIRPVARYSLDGKFIDERPSITSYVEEYGFHAGNICQCCQGKLNSANGYKWMYVDKEGYLEDF